MSHTRKHKLEHLIDGIDQVNREKLAGIKDVFKTIPGQSDYVRYLRNKYTYLSVNGDDGINWLVQEGSFIYIATGHRILKCNKSDLEIVNSNDNYLPRAYSNIFCLTTNFIFVISGYNKIIKLNKSDLSFVSEFDTGIYLAWIETDGVYLYCAEYADPTLYRYDLDLVAQGTLAMAHSYSWAIKYAAGYLYIEHEEIGMTIEKIDVSTFTSVGEGDFSASWAGVYYMTIMGTNLYFTAGDLTYSNFVILKISDALVEIGNTPLTTLLTGICNDGTYIYYSDDDNLKVKKIDGDLNAVEEALTGFTTGFYACDADIDNLFLGDIVNPATWAKFTKISITKIDEETGIAYEQINTGSNQYPSDGESLFYTTNINFCKLNIDTFEIEKRAFTFTGIEYASFDVFACDDSKVYGCGYMLDGSYDGFLLVFDINTLELLNKIDLPYVTYETVLQNLTVDDNNIFIACSGRSTPATSGKVLKIDKLTYSVTGTFSTGDTIWRNGKGVLLTKDYLYYLVNRGSPYAYRVYKIDPTTMAEVSYSEMTEIGTYLTSSLIWDGDNYLFYTSGGCLYRVDLTTMITVMVTYPYYALYFRGISYADNYVITECREAHPPITNPHILLIDPKQTNNRVGYWFQPEVIRDILITDLPAGIGGWDDYSNGRNLFLKGFLFLTIGNYLCRFYLRSDESWRDLTKSPKEATVIVAANNASDKVKFGADYICDGTDDQVEINAALDYVNGLGGGKVSLSEGQFELATAVYGKSKTILEGQGIATILNVSATIPNNWAINSYNYNNDFIIKNFKIVNNASAAVKSINLEGVDCQVESVVITGGGIGICTTGVRNIIIGNQVKTTLESGIYCNGDNSIIKNNICGGNAGVSGIDVRGNDCIIENNIANNNTTGSGIHTSSGERIVIKGNICIGNFLHGIYAYPCNIIEGNECRLNRQLGINAYLGVGSIVSNNMLRDNSQEGDNLHAEIGFYTDCNYNTIEGNNIRCTLANKASHGIKITTGDYNIILGNLIQGAHAGISASGANDIKEHNIELP